MIDLFTSVNIMPQWMLMLRLITRIQFAQKLSLGFIIYELHSIINIIINDSFNLFARVEMYFHASN